MGVYGLWRLIDATGKHVPLDTLEGKVLAIDVSIWIHQVLQGYQDRFGNPKPNAHLIGLFNRICKLLYYKIKPVFVFDGGVPMLKKDTIALRRKQKSIARNKAQQKRTELINNLIKHSAVKTVLNTDKQIVTNGSTEGTSNSQKKQTADDIFKLPDLPNTDKEEIILSDEYDSDSSIELSPRKQTKWMGNIHSVDVSSTEFKALPADVRYEILTDLKETRKQNSWGRLHEMPEESGEFSGFQMKRLLKRRLVQESLESAEKEMGGKTLTLEELNKLLTEQGVTTNACDYAHRIAGDSTTRLIYISDKNAQIKSNSSSADSNNAVISNRPEEETDEPIPGSSKGVPICEDMNEYEFIDDWDSDIEITAVDNSKMTMEMGSEESEIEFNESRSLSKKYFGKNIMNPALTYMLEYSGLTEKQILFLLEQNKKESNENAASALKAREIDSLKAHDIERKNNLLNIEHLDSECKDAKEFGKPDFVETTKSIPVQKTELSKANVSNEKQFKSTETAVINTGSSKSTMKDNETFSNRDSTTAAEPIVIPKTVLSEPTAESDIEEIKVADGTVISTTDSDSDDFIEIEDTPVSNADTRVKKSGPQQAIQITFKSDQKIEDDMFSDIFGMSNDESNTEANSRNTSVSSGFCEKSVKSIVGDQEIIDSIITVEETIETSAEVHVRDEQSPEAITVKGVHAEFAENDTDIIEMNVQLEKNQMKEIRCVDNTGFQESGTEDINIQDTANANVSLTIDESERISPLPVNEEELLSLKARLEDEQTDLMANIGKLERQGIDISDRIRVEAQELLRLFGIPYVVAPMEAEAQCAYLEQIHLTDGTITDDSDIWLFGGQCVYKNFFDNNKKVLQFRACDIQHHFKLTRNEMIRLALLVGSDYTVGLTGIGPVTALEILAAFPSEGDNLLQGLTDFYSWMNSGRSAGPGKAGLRNKLQNLQVQKGFPRQAVVQGYLFPEVDESKEGFTWGKPNTMLLSNYARQKFGWNKTKFNEIMNPILKRLEEKQNQKSIAAYFKVQTIPKSIEMTLSKRVQKAVQRLNNQNAEEPEDVAENMQSQIKKKPKSSNENRKKRKGTKNEQGESDIVEPKICNVAAPSDKNVKEYIPQREKDKAESLKKKLHAIEVLRKSKQGLYKTKKVKRCVRKVKEEAELSESDSSGS